MDGAASDVRAAELSDAERVFELLTQFAVSYRPSREAFDRSFPCLAADDGVCFLVAELAGEVIGYVLAHRLATLYANGPIMEMQELMVDPAHRSQGIGRRLVAAAVERAWATGCVEVTVPTRRAGEFYAGLGFEETAAYYKLRRP